MSAPQARRYRRIPALVIAITMLAMVLGGIVLYYLERHLVETAGKSLAIAAVDVADKLDLLLYERYGDITIMAGAPVFQGQDHEAMTRFLSRLKSTYPVYQWLAATDAAGRIIAAASPSDVHTDQSGEEWFKAIRNQDGIHLQDAQPLNDSRDSVVVTFSAPIKGPHGEFHGAVTTRVALPVIEEIFVRTPKLLQPELDRPVRIEWQLLTHDGLVITDSVLRQEGKVNLKQLGTSSALLLESGEPGYVEEQHRRRQVPVITGYARTKGYHSYPGLGWGVLIRMDRSNILAPIQSFLLKVGAVGLVIYLPMLGLLLWTSRRLREEWGHAREAEATLRASYQVLHSTLNALPAYIAMLDASGTIIDVNDHWRRFVAENQGWGPAGRLGDNYLELCESPTTESSADASACAAGIRAVMARQQDDFRLDYACHSALQTRWFSARVTRVEAEGPVRIVVLHSDITHRKVAENALADERNRLAVTLRSIGDAVITTDIQGRVALMNIVAETLTAWTQADAIGRPLAEVFHIINEKTRQPCENPVEKVLATGGIIGLANHTALIAKDGTERVIADSGSPIRSDDGATIGVVLVFRDITERIKMEQEILTARKLESLGVLAGGIAHDFNNILTAILGNLSLAKLSIDPKDELAHLLNEAEKASLRARGLTQQLLTFAKGGAPIKKSTSLKELIEDTVRFVLHGSNVLPEFTWADDLWPVEADEGQISQVIHNLVLNAQQAMPTGGTLQIAGENIQIGSKGSDQPLALPDGPYVRLSLIDQGTGIADHHLLRIFDPYFTTKQTGSGLGLTTAYSIVQKHGGHISVRSTLGRGSTFQMYLPASPGSKVRKEKSSEQTPLSSLGRILIMDDEEPVRLLLSRVLKHIGYESDAVRDGTEAITFYRQAHAGGRPYQAVILDLTIPGGMGGQETLSKLQELDPQVNAIASSGYATESLAQVEEHGFRGMLAKPYQIEEVREALARIIHKQQKA